MTTSESLISCLTSKEPETLAAMAKEGAQVLKNQDEFIAAAVKMLMILERPHYRTLLEQTQVSLTENVTVFEEIERAAGELPHTESLAPLREEMLAMCQLGRQLSMDALEQWRVRFQQCLKPLQGPEAAPEYAEAFELFHQGFLTFYYSMEEAGSKARQAHHRTIALQPRYVALDTEHCVLVTNLQDEKSSLEQAADLLRSEPLPDLAEYTTKFFAIHHNCTQSNIRFHFDNFIERLNKADRKRISRPKLESHSSIDSELPPTIEGEASIASGLATTGGNAASNESGLPATGGDTKRWAIEDKAIAERFDRYLRSNSRKRKSKRKA